MIFRESLDTGVVARLWRQANVVPIFKKGDKAESSNYRPIIARAIRRHLDEHKLIRHSQHGFSKVYLKP